MDVRADGILIVANTDNGSVTVVDTAASKALREIKVGEKPEGVTWIGAGPLAAVTVYRESAVVFLDSRDGKIVQKIPVPNEPYGIVANRAGTRLWVTYEYPGSVSEIDLAKRRRWLRELKAGSFLRGIALAPTKTPLRQRVLHRHPARHRPERAARSSIPGRDIRPTTWPATSLLHPRRPKAYLSHIRSKIEVNDGGGSIFPQLSICDLVPPDDDQAAHVDRHGHLQRRLRRHQPLGGGHVARRQAALHHLRRHQRHERLARSSMTITRRSSAIGSAVPFGQNPRAVRVSPDGKTVYVYNALDFAVGIYDAQPTRGSERSRCASRRRRRNGCAARFCSTPRMPPMTGRRWIACSSCHPDGHTDGRVWQQPRGPAQDAGLLRAGPHASAALVRRPRRGAGLRVHHPRPADAGPRPATRHDQAEGRLPGRRAGGNLAGRSAGPRRPGDLHQFVRVHRLSPHIPAPGKLSAAGRARQGALLQQGGRLRRVPQRAVLHRQQPEEAVPACTTSAPARTTPAEKIGPKYDTPTLLGVYRTAPYLHHGKAKTLRDVLTTCNKDDRHGKTSHLQAGRDRRPGRVLEVASLRVSAAGDAQHGEIPRAAEEEREVIPLPKRITVK